MTKKGLQGIATGIFISTALFAYMYFFQAVEVESHEEETEIPELELSSEEMMEILSNQGFVILEEEEYQLLLNTKEQDADDVDQIADTEAVIYSSILVIQPGMSSKAVSEQLANIKIIDDADMFIQYLENANLTQQLKVGEYELNSEMTYEAIAEIITKG